MEKSPCKERYARQRPAHSLLLYATKVDRLRQRQLWGHPLPVPLCNGIPRPLPLDTEHLVVLEDRLVVAGIAFRLEDAAHFPHGWNPTEVRNRHLDRLAPFRYPRFLG